MGSRVALTLSAITAFGGLALDTRAADETRSSCIQRVTAQGIVEVENRNAREKAENYGRPHARTAADYSTHLGKTYDDVMARPGRKLVMDMGGGYGIASLQAAARKGVRALVINAQDFWAHFAVTPNQAEIQDIAAKLEVPLKGLPTSYKWAISVTGRFKVWDFSRFKPRHYEILRKRTLNKVNKLKKEGRFDYREGFVEDVLLKISEKADLITDAWGAAFYSADRARLFDAYYRQLNPDGVAVIRVRDSSGEGISDRIELSKDSSIGLLEYLIQTYPDVFSWDPQNRNVLVMKKIQGIADLGLSDSLEGAEPKWIPFNDTQIPEVQWRMKRKR